MLNNVDEHTHHVLGGTSDKPADKLQATGGTPCTYNASIQPTKNTGTVGSTREQIWQIGSCVHPGYKWTFTVYSYPVTVEAVAGDTPVTIAAKIAAAINATSQSQWQSKNSAPAVGTPGFKPTAYSGSDMIRIILNYQNQFAASASGTYTAPAAPAATVYKAHGTVTNAHSGEKFPGAPVSFKTPSGQPYGSPITTDANGAWAYDLPSSDYKVIITGVPQGDLFPEWQVYENPASVVGNGSNLAIAIPQWTTSGKIVNQNGDAIPNVEYDLIRADGTQFNTEPYSTDAEGNWSILLYKHLGYYSLRFNKPGYATKDILVEDANANNVQLVSNTPASVNDPEPVQEEITMPVPPLPQQIQDEPTPVEEKKTTVINAIFPPAYNPYISSPGGSGGGAGGGEMLSGATPKDIKKMKSIFWMVVGATLVSSFLFFNPSQNIAGGKI